MSFNSGGAMKFIRTIRNCADVFRKVCPLSWDELIATSDASIRHCEKCNRSVFLCDSDEETISHAEAGHCIARAIPADSELPLVYLGEPKSPRNPPPWTSDQEKAVRLRSWERGVDSALKDFKYSTRKCPQCRYPVPNWRLTCHVCGLEIGRRSKGAEEAF